MAESDLIGKEVFLVWDSGLKDDFGNVKAITYFGKLLIYDEREARILTKGREQSIPIGRVIRIEPTKETEVVG